jgi:alkylated DNA repair dioxygenase AlkB
VQELRTIGATEFVRTDLGGGAFLELAQGFVEDDREVMDALCAELDLRAETIVLFGRPVPVPRLVAYHADPGRYYRYSGRDHAPVAWPPLLGRLRERLCAATGTPYDSVLCNHYRDGSDSMGRHADDEPELGPLPADVRIASISLGARRTFRMRPRAGGARLDLELGGGDLLVMGGTTQTLFVHEVPRTRRVVGPRLNLTFRCVAPRDGVAE